MISTKDVLFFIAFNHKIIILYSLRPEITVASVILQNGPRIISDQIHSPRRSETKPSLATRSPSRSTPARRRRPRALLRLAAAVLRSSSFHPRSLAPARSPPPSVASRRSPPTFRGEPPEMFDLLVQDCDESGIGEVTRSDAVAARSARSDPSARCCRPPLREGDDASHGYRLHHAETT